MPCPASKEPDTAPCSLLVGVSGATSVERMKSPEASLGQGDGEVFGHSEVGGTGISDSDDDGVKSPSYLVHETQNTSVRRQDRVPPLSETRISPVGQQARALQKPVHA